MSATHQAARNPTAHPAQSNDAKLHRSTPFQYRHVDSAFCPQVESRNCCMLADLCFGCGDNVVNRDAKMLV
jgi:hypothetical protein